MNRISYLLLIGIVMLVCCTNFAHSTDEKQSIKAVIVDKGVMDNGLLINPHLTGPFKLRCPGWVSTWGDTGSDLSCAMAIDSRDIIHVTGNWENVISKTDKDFFYHRFDTSGQHLPSIRIANNFGDFGEDIAVDAAGNVYVAKLTDFYSNPLQGQQGIVVLEKYDVNLNVQTLWKYAWGIVSGSSSITGYIPHIKVAVADQNDVYIAGMFIGEVALNPYNKEEIVGSPEGPEEIFLIKLDSSGVFKWLKTWGSTGNDEVLNVFVGPHNEYVYVTGCYSWGKDATLEFEKTDSYSAARKLAKAVDFDPGAGTDNHTSNGHWDSFVNKFDFNGNFIWARTWGGKENYEAGYGLYVCDMENVYVSGKFAGEVNFDPAGSSAGIKMAAGYQTSPTVNIDAYLVSFTPDGKFRWVDTWGWEGGKDGGGDIARAVTMNHKGQLLVTGGIVPKASVTNTTDIFVRTLDSDGNLGNYQIVPGDKVHSDTGYDIAVDSNDCVYVTGECWKSVNFNGIEPFVAGEADAFLWQRW